MTAPKDLLAKIGHALYGARWKSQIARDLKLSDGSIRHWLTGRMPLSRDHGIFRDLEVILETKLAEISEALKALRSRGKP